MKANILKEKINKNVDYRIEIIGKSLKNEWLTIRNFKQTGCCMF